MRTTLAILNKQCKDSLNNLPSLMIMIIYPAVAFIMVTALGSQDGIDGPMSSMFISMFATMHCAFVPITIASTVISEEKEKGTLRSLIMSGVGRVNYLISISLFIIVAVMLTGCTFLLMDKFTHQEMCEFIVTMLCGTVISTLLGLCIGINAKNVAAASGTAMPVGLVLALLPMLAQFNDAIAKVSKFTYSGQISLVLEGGRAVTAEMLEVCGAYAVIFAVLLTLIFRKKGLE
ncbi:MAG: ABC transporter permease [Acutalibacteraceae bacterium]